MKYKPEDYLNTEFYGNEDYEIRAVTKKIVKTRKPQYCAFSGILDKEHDVPVGSQALYEHAIVEGKWGSSYSCLPCLDVWLDHIYKGTGF